MLKDINDTTPSGSLKKVEFICDYCGSEFLMANRTRNDSRKIIEKDSCKKCSILKRRESCLIKYGTETASQSRSVKIKALETKGKECKVIEDFKDEIIELCSKPGMSIKYISEKFNIHCDSVKSYCDKLGLILDADNQTKMKRTMQEKYGAEHSMQVAEIKKRVIESNLKNYQDEDRKEEIIGKIKSTLTTKYGTDDILNKSDRQSELQEKRRATRVKNGHEVSYEGKTSKELAAKIGINLSSFHERVRKIGLEAAIKTEKHNTYLESILEEYLKSINIEYKTQYYVAGKIADIFIPSHNLIIEADGLYWHSDQIIKDNNYHVKKRQLYLDNQLKPLFFRADEINDKLEIVKSVIANKLQLSIKKNGRDCIIKELSPTESKAFFAANHLMGAGKGFVYGLELDGEIVSAIQIKTKEGTSYEISRFCNKLNLNVRGAYSRLIAHFIKDVPTATSLITYVDLRYGQGDYLENLGFVYSGTNPSFKWTDSHKTFHRMNFPKNEGYDKGLAKIWDCGQALYTLTIKR